MMTHFKQPPIVAVVCLVTLLYAQSTAVTLQNEIAQEQQRQQSQVVPTLLTPIVNVDKGGNVSKVDVHVPVFFDMTNKSDNTTGQNKLDLEVLGGLVTVNRRTEKTASDGVVTGPLSVSILGIPVFSGNVTGTQFSSNASFAADREGRLGELAKFQEKVLSMTVESIKSAVADVSAVLPATRINAEMRQFNDNILNSLSGTLKRFASRLDRRSTVASNKNGSPAHSGLVAPSTFSRSDLEPRITHQGSLPSSGPEQNKNGTLTDPGSTVAPSAGSASSHLEPTISRQSATPELFNNSSPAAS